MSFKPDDTQHNESVEELIAENTRWLKVIAFLIGELAGVDETGVYEDLD